MPFLALPLLALTLGGIVARPRGLPEWVYAAAGAVAVVAVGAISVPDALAAIGARWDVFLFFLGLMTIAAVADVSGLVERLTAAAARASLGRRDLLLAWISLLAVGVTITLSNDATVLVLTPLVVAMTSRLRVPVLPYAFACAYLANAASPILPVANPANVLVLRGAPIAVLDYLGELAFPAVAACVFVVAYLRVSFRTELDGGLERPAAPPRDLTAALVGAGVLLVVVAYLVALDRQWPIGVVAACGGASLLALLAVRGRLDVAAIAGGVEWRIFPFLAGLVVVVTAAEHAGLTAALSWTIDALGRLGAPGLVLLGMAAAAAANAMNNLPLAILAGGALADFVGRADLPRLVSAVIVGVDIGPNFTTIGSLATLMWLMVLRRRDVIVTNRAYLRRSAFPSFASLLVALALVALRPR